MTLTSPDVKLIGAYNKVRRLRRLFNRTQEALVAAHEQYDTEVNRYGGRIVGVSGKATVVRRRRCKAVNSYELKQGTLELQP